MTSVNINIFQYDIGIQDGFNEAYYDKFFKLDRTALKENGHLEYILKIYSNGALLDSNTNQAYHPPLNHIILASFIKVLDGFGASNKFKIEALEFPSVIFSVLIIVVIYKIMKEIGLSSKQIILPISIIIFHPLFIFMSRLINNDNLVTLFSLVSILYLIKWHKKPTYKNTIILALAIGFGGMTKTSIVVMAVPLLFTYMKKLLGDVEDSKELKRIVFEGLLFACISLPLICWYPIRNAIKFGQPPFSIITASETLKVASINFMDRWILNSELFNHLLMKNSSNVCAYVINSSIAFMIEATIIPKYLSLILKLLSVILIVISFMGIGKYTRKQDNKQLLYILVTTYFSWIIGFIYFNISLPYSCTMHVRYIVVSMIIGIIYIGIFYNNIKSLTLKKMLKILIVLFEIISIIFIVYLTIKTKILLGV